MRELEIFIIFSLLLGTATSAAVYVSGNGFDRHDCGATAAVPCETLAWAIGHADDGDVIRLDGARGRAKYRLCASRNASTSFVADFKIETRGRRTYRALLYCDADDRRIDLRSSVSFANVEIVNVSFFVVDNSTVALNVLNSTLRNVNIRSSGEGAKTLTIRMESCTYFGVLQQQIDSHYPRESVMVMAAFARVEYHSVTFMSVHQRIQCMRCHMLLQHVRHTNAPDYVFVFNQIKLMVGAFSDNSVLIEDSIFENQYDSDPTAAVIKLFDAALYIHGIPMKGVTAYNVTAIVRRCVFINNERALTFARSLGKTYVIDSLFRGNIAMHAGPAITYICLGTTNSYVKNSTFDSNHAGAYRENLIAPFVDVFQVNGDQVRVNSSKSKGVISLVGKGGAIRVQRTRCVISNSVFLNNTASRLGGAVYVDRECDLEIVHCRMENSLTHVHSAQGDLIYSDGILSIRDVFMNVRTADSHIAQLRHSGKHWSIEVVDAYVQCPSGYRLRVTNSSAYRVIDVGLKRSSKLDQLSYFCESCERNKYSLDAGFLNFSLTYSTPAYYTLLINGSQPTIPYKGSFDHHDIQCLECPYGAKCVDGLRSVPNFWGFIYNGNVRFQHCPKGYCCSLTKCLGYNQCADHREGTICAICSSGYSEALFSPKCIPDENCNIVFLWPLAIFSGFLYTMFLLYQKDLRDGLYSVMLRFANAREELGIPRCSDHCSIMRSDVDDAPTAALTTTSSDLRMSCVNSQDELSPTDQKGDHHEMNNREEDVEPANVDTGASFLIILFYYFQDAQLLNITTVFAKADSASRTMIKTILSGLFKFRLEVFQFLDQICFIKHVTPSGKLFVKIALVPYVLFQFGLIYLLCQLWYRIKSKRSGLLPNDPDSIANKSFLSKLSTGFVLALLFMYQKLATTSFRLLNCVPVGDQSVLFVEGTVVCYEGWQIGVMVYALTCIVPFCCVLMLGPGLLKDSYIGLHQFFCACICPTPFLIYWLGLRLRLNGKRPTSQPALSAPVKAVIQILQGPFKESESHLFGPYCGQGGLIGRRLILVILYTFVNDPLLRLLSMMATCFCFLLHHVHVLPFKDSKGNLAGSMSASALLIVCGMNLVRAGFESAEYIPIGPNLTLMMTFDELENVLLLWFPLAVVSIIFLLAGSILILNLIKWYRNSGNVTNSSSSSSSKPKDRRPRRPTDNASTESVHVNDVAL